MRNRKTRTNSAATTLTASSLETVRGGARQHKPITVIKPLDKATPLLAVSE